MTSLNGSSSLRPQRMALTDQLLIFQDAQRTAEIANTLEKWRDDRKRTDVTGRWKGWAPNGMGRVEYRGVIYPCKVIARTCKQIDANVNLRRTQQGNFAVWD